VAHVLVIDDDEEIRTLLRHVLARAGHSVDVASDGAEGLRRFGSRRPDVVITDIDMPNLDGHAVIEALRTARSDVPIVAISGGGPAAKDELLLQAARLGAAEVVTKPFGFEQLVGAVARALTLWEPQRKSPRPGE
jgi:CheY-like chemotaxis protein